MLLVQTRKPTCTAHGSITGSHPSFRKLYTSSSSTASSTTCTDATGAAGCTTACGACALPYCGSRKEAARRLKDGKRKLRVGGGGAAGSRWAAYPGGEAAVPYRPCGAVPMGPGVGGWLSDPTADRGGLLWLKRSACVGEEGAGPRRELVERMSGGTGMGDAGPRTAAVLAAPAEAASSLTCSSRGDMAASNRGSS